MLSVLKLLSFKYQTLGPPGSWLVALGPPGPKKCSKLVVGYVTVVIGTNLILLVVK